MWIPSTTSTLAFNTLQQLLQTHFLPNPTHQPFLFLPVISDFRLENQLLAKTKAYILASGKTVAQLSHSFNFKYIFIVFILKNPPCLPSKWFLLATFVTKGSSLKVSLKMKEREWIWGQRAGSGSEGLLLGEGSGSKSQAWEDSGGRKLGWSLPWEFHMLSCWKGSTMAKFNLVIFLLGTTCSCKSILHHWSTLKRSFLVQKLLSVYFIWYAHLIVHTMCSAKRLGHVIYLCS